MERSCGIVEPWAESFAHVHLFVCSDGLSTRDWSLGWGLVRAAVRRRTGLCRCSLSGGHPLMDTSHGDGDGLLFSLGCVHESDSRWSWEKINITDEIR